MDNRTTACFFITGLLTGCLLIVIISTVMIGEQRKAIDDYKQEAIEHGFAHFDKTTGEWQWNGDKH